MRIINIVFCLCLAHNSIVAQKEDYQWVFNWTSIDNVWMSDDAGASILDFNVDPPIFYRNERLTLDLDLSNASICNKEGQLLFFSNQQAIQQGNGDPVINGDTINFGPNWQKFVWPNEHDQLKPTGFSHPQGIGVISRPEHMDSTYYILYMNSDEYLDTNKLRMLYAIIEKEENKKFKVLVKDIMIRDDVTEGGILTACQHANGRDWWILFFKDNLSLSYILDPSGFKLHTTSSIPFKLRTGVGQGKFNPSGNKLAIHKGIVFEDSLGMDFALFDFDRCTGILSNGIIKSFPSWNSGLSNSVEFSGNGRYVYRGDLVNIYQYDTEAGDFFGSELVVGTYDGYTNLYNVPAKFGLMQRGPDNKIYIPVSFQDHFIHRINNPNAKGMDCDIQQRAIRLPTFVKGTVPTVNTYRLGPVDGSLCDTLDIDNYPVAQFRYEQDTMDFLNIQFVDLSYYDPKSWYWDFGDGYVSTEESPRHFYTNKGAYRVCLTVENNISNHTSCQELNLGTVSIDKVNFEYHISIFPNPVDDYCRIAIHNYLPQEAIIRLKDIKGQLINQKVLLGQETLIDLSEQSAGFYLYEIWDRGVMLKSGKLVKI